ncbi:hypothetical protein NEISICOT_03396 [Neisseria sicca ATCC 29256]|uniref:Calcineurin-like phosphoesterase domain-containing protein n=1 Tax=Neisseria sicca ATCC 29256 TaxID=547045 RepID=C6MA15_NEISI|nr:hypothetical protein NEISICOT_03396 [Neisseria sicca ATCC 29256]
MSYQYRQSLPDTPLDIVGDVHGEFAAFQSLLHRLGYRDDGFHPRGRRLVFVGDLCDRGPDSPAMLAWFKQAYEHGWAWMVLGNHELNILADDPKDGSGWFFDVRAEKDAHYAPWHCVEEKKNRIARMAGRTAAAAGARRPAHCPRRLAAAANRTPRRSKGRKPDRAIPPLRCRVETPPSDGLLVSRLPLRTNALRPAGGKSRPCAAAHARHRAIRTRTQPPASDTRPHQWRGAFGGQAVLRRRTLARYDPLRVVGRLPRRYARRYRPLLAQLAALSRRRCRRTAVAAAAAGCVARRAAQRVLRRFLDWCKLAGKEIPAEIPSRTVPAGGIALAGEGVGV